MRVLEEVIFILEGTGGLPVLGFLAIFCLALAAIALTRNLRRRAMARIAESPRVRRIRQWLVENPDKVAAGIGVVGVLVTAALLVEPIRLLVHGTTVDGVVTELVESTRVDEKGKTIVRSTATIRFQAAGRNRAIHRSTSRESGSSCFAGCFSRGERLKIVYLEENPEVAEVRSFSGLFTAPLVSGVIAALAFVFARLFRSERAGRVTE